MYMHLYNIYLVCMQVYSCIHTCMHAYIYMHIHTHTYTYIHIHTHTYTYIRIHARTYTCIHIHTHTCTYMFSIYMCVYMIIHVHVWVRSNPRPDSIPTWVPARYASYTFFHLPDISANSKQGNEILTSLNIRKFKKNIWFDLIDVSGKKESKILISPISQEKTYCFELLNVTGKKGNKTLISLNLRKAKTP